MYVIAGPALDLGEAVQGLGGETAGGVGQADPRHGGEDAFILIKITF